MIYRIRLKHTRRTDAGLSLYAHPEWPWVIGPDGDPRFDFKVLFIRTPGRDEFDLEVYASAGSGIHYRVMRFASANYPLEYTWDADEVEFITDLTKVG